MRRLAELLPELGQADEPVVILARMLGVGGLLPDQLDRDKLTNRYLRTLWDQWWRDRLAKRILPRDVWTFHGLRPANRRERRLALAACWLSRPDFVPWLDDWACKTETRPTPAAALLGHLTASDEYWSTHWTFRSGRFPKAQPLLGAGRLHDIAVNVILPWLYARASADDNTGLRQRVVERYFAWPKGQDNSRLRFVRQRLLVHQLREIVRAHQHQASRRRPRARTSRPSTRSSCACTRSRRSAACAPSARARSATRRSSRGRRIERHALSRLDCVAATFMSDLTRARRRRKTETRRNEPHGRCPVDTGCRFRSTCRIVGLCGLCLPG